VIGKLSFHCQPVSLEVAHLAGIPIQYFDAAGCASCVTATPVQDIYTGVLDREHQFFSLGRFYDLSSGRSFGFNLRH
jgi:hypothetical protein